MVEEAPSSRCRFACTADSFKLFSQQFRAVMLKNWLLKLRTWKASLAEILLPVGVVLIMVAARSAVNKEEVPDQHWVSDNRTYNATAVLEELNTVWLLRLNQRIAFVPGTEGTMSREIGNAFVNQFPFLSSRIDFRFDVCPLLSVGNNVAFAQNEKAFESYIKSKSYTKKPEFPPFWAALVFKKFGTVTDPKWEYEIRMNATGREDQYDRPPKIVPDTRIEPGINELDISYRRGPWLRYFYYGFLSLQHFTDQYILNYTTSKEADIGFTAVPFPVPGHIDDTFSELVGAFLGLFYTLVYMWPVTRVVGSLVSEKEERIKEAMKIMGLSDSVHIITWLLTYMASFAITGALVTFVTWDNVFEFSDKGLIFLLFLLFGFAVFGLCFLISVFFTRARIAGTIAGIVYLISFFPFFVVADEDAASSDKTAACLVPSICLGLAGKLAADLESAGTGITIGTLTREYANFQFSTALLMLFVDFLLYFSLGLYLTKTWKSTYGVPLPWNFPFMKSYWFPKTVQSAAESEEKDEKEEFDMRKSTRHQLMNMMVEPVPSSMAPRRKVQLHKLRKTFETEQGTLVAVEGLDLDCYEGQVLALLGHNGAGKTTTISMLTGLYQPSDGNATVYGQGIVENMQGVRTMLGFCPQHNILFPSLTVREHLALYARLKGTDPERIPGDVEEMIKKVGLEGKEDAQTGTLSGGQKRKVHVGIALIGDSKVVFLDEPTSGMDPYSRHATWDLIKTAKEGRVIVLTTHFMDEADHLGDRIAIMGKGMLKCCGSSLFLKSKYGVGYTMVLSRKSQVKSSSVSLVELINSFVPAAEVLSDAAGEVSFRIPFEASKKFPDLFRVLDSRLEELGLQNYGISVTTLEEVFLRVGRDEEIQDQEERKKLVREYSQIRQVSESIRQPSETNVLDGVAAEKVRRFSGLTKDVVMEALPAMPVIEEVKEDDGSLKTGKFKARATSFTTQLWALLVKRWQNTKRDRKAWMWQLVYPTVMLIAGVGLVKLSIDFDFSSFSMNTLQFGPDNPIPFSQTTALSTSLTTNQVFDNNVPVYPANAMSYRNMSDYLLDSFWTQSYEHPRYGAYVVESLDTSTQVAVEAAAFLNTSSIHALPTFFNLLSNMLLQTATSQDDAYIKTSLKPMPRTADQMALTSSLTALMISIAFAFIPASYASFVVHETTLKAKHQQIISGVNIYAYWVANLIWDACNFMIPGLLCIVVLLMYNIEETIGENLPAMFTLIVLFGLSAPCFTYLISFLFSDHSVAQNVVLLINIFFGVVLLIGSIILDIISSTRPYNAVFIYFYRLAPPFAFGMGVVGLIVREASIAVGRPRNQWDMDIIGWSCLYMTLTAVVYFGLVFLIEKVKRNPWMLSKIRREVTLKDAPYEVDEDVRREEERVSRGEAADDTILVRNLRKVFPPRMGAPPKAAVKHLTFGIPEGECFGFLGINGAGKTTTLKILTGDLLPSEGSAQLCGEDILESQDTRQMIGYCPQFDALLPNMTGREQLVMYARIKGIPEEAIQHYVDILVEQLGLQEYENKRCAGYSGGNKRKLSVGISLIGDPSIVFLDEPSTGMDPKSRRFLWDLISSTMVGRSVILTTHSMEECEALCSRIGIMVSGRLRCLGSAHHLKARFGSGWQLDFATGGHSNEEARRFIQGEFPDVKPLEIHDTRMKYRLPRGERSIGEVFAIIEANRERLHLTEYSVSETTLEQIFIHFAKQQTLEEEGILVEEEMQKPARPNQAAVVPLSAAEAKPMATEIEMGVGENL